MKYKVYRRQLYDKRAPSKISISNDYKYLGDVTATTLSEAIRKWINKENTTEAIPIGNTLFNMGDVIIQGDNAYIHTGRGIWASVINID